MPRPPATTTAAVIPAGTAAEEDARSASFRVAGARSGVRSVCATTPCTAEDALGIWRTDFTEPSVLSRTCLLLGCLKSKADVSDPARVSKEASPIRPVCQLSSMNRVIEACSVRVWSTELTLL